MKHLLFISLFTITCIIAYSQTANQKPFAPGILPGKGLAEHDFLYAGEGKQQNIYIIRNGQIAWQYKDTVTKGEISDAVLMTNGNILFAHQYGITLINAGKKILWHYDAPAGHEIHTAQPIGKQHIVYVENGDTGRVKVVNIITGETVKEFSIPVAHSKSVHGQFRHARLTKKGTLLVSHMDMGLVNEYNINGKLLNSIPVPGVWGAEPLDNGNILVSCRGSVKEISPKADTVWRFAFTEIPEYNIISQQLAIPLPNGNIVFNTWFNQWSDKLDISNAPPQVFEVTRDRKLVWVLRAWTEPLNLGPATTIQFLDDKRISENVFFGNIK